MNGINPKVFDNFWHKWELITTRFRKDNSEQRFVYANSIAYNAMKLGSLVFPDGAVFGKLAFKAVPDAQFPNSLEPTNFTRLQIMVKNAEKFKENNGWAYYIYVDGKSHPPASDQNKQLACHACHLLVKDRDFVFSAPTFLSTVGSLYSNIGNTFDSIFHYESKKDLSKFEREMLKLLRSNPKGVMIRRMRLFSGSLSESIAPLAKYVQSGKAYAMIDPIGKRFLLVERTTKPISKCGRTGARVYLNLKKNGDWRLKEGLVCEGYKRWLSSKKMPFKMRRTL